jgi:hypothetical protein
MEYTLIERNSPSAEEAGKRAVNISGSYDLYGAHSIEVFPQLDADGQLRYTHDDARGFMAWYGKYDKGNFWIGDSGVKPWAYEEAYDNFNDTYGMDSVVVFYHSGHGVMDNNGVFYAPLGGYWDNRINVNSSNMKIGNEQLKYLFWSTCQSLKVPDLAVMNPTRKSPIDTWHGSNLGLRMIFGFHSNSLDHSGYGSLFGSNWDSGQPFSTAWLNASWAISHNQIATVCAMGATREQAQNFLFNERYFYQNSVPANWYSWRWGNFENPVLGTRTLDSQKIPKNPVLLHFGKPVFSGDRILKLGDMLELSKKELAGIGMERNGSIVANGKDKQLTVDSEGRLTAILGAANYKNTTQLDSKKIFSMAEKELADLNFKDKGIELCYDSLRIDKVQSCTTKGSGTIEEPYITETTVIFRQAHNGIKGINNNHGLVMMTYDNDGTLTKIHNSTREIESVSNKPQHFVGDPVKGRKTHNFELLGDQELNTRLLEKLEKTTGVYDLHTKSAATLGAKVTDSKDGFDFSGSSGEIVAHREYEVDKGVVNGQAFVKGYRVRVPLYS